MVRRSNGTIHTLLPARCDWLGKEVGQVAKGLNPGRRGAKGTEMRLERTPGASGPAENVTTGTWQAF